MMSLKDIRDNLTPEVNAIIEDMTDLEFDTINNPKHYNAGSIETIDYIVDVLGEYDAIHYCHGNILKYTGSRLWNKGDPVSNAKKAAWYLNKMIELMECTEGTNW
jgi:enoyl-CoA hydratase/carnithine racemase